MYDVLIIGGGPAGLTAGLYASREGLKTAVLEMGTIGGQAAQTDVIENYPGFPEGITGPELMQSFEKQALRFGLEIIRKEAKGISVEDGVKKVYSDQGLLSAGALIIATGTKPRELEVPGEQQFRGRGVSYCATCDGAFFRGRKVAVVGGGNAAVEEALFLTKFAREVIIIHRRDQLRASDILRKRAIENDKIGFRWETVIEAIEGEQVVKSLRLKNIKTGEVYNEEFNGVFIFIGSNPRTNFLKGTVTLTNQGFILTGEDMKTSLPGVFAAGDVREKKYRQIATAVGDGTQAALEAGKFLDEQAK